MGGDRDFVCVGVCRTMCAMRVCTCQCTGYPSFWGVVDGLCGNRRLDARMRLGVSRQVRQISVVWSGLGKGGGTCNTHAHLGVRDGVVHFSMLHRHLSHTHTHRRHAGRRGSTLNLHGAPPTHTHTQAYRTAAGIVQTVYCTAHHVALSVMEFAFMGGSMGGVVGENSRASS
jgi:hypothetical protein